MASPQLENTPNIPEPHPYLHEPVIYITSLPPYITDEMLAAAFASCAPFRPIIPRDDSQRPLSGTIEFKYLDRAEKALATLQGRPIPNTMPPIPLVLSPWPPTDPPTPLPPPSALPRIVKQLPPQYDDAHLFDLFRPFGALASVRSQTGFGPDVAIVEFWREEDARTAEEAMHCAEVDGMNISVQVFQSRRPSTGSAMAVPAHEFSPNANAPTFVPTGTMYAYPTQYSPPRGTPYLMRPTMFVHGPGQQVQLAPPTGPGSTSHSGLIDPCNLFCKNLDPDIDSNGLFTHFRQFGQIVSARVMRNENGESRGFGFVSFQTPDQASAAMRTMNGAQLGSKQIVVRLHEPKQLRQEKLAQRFGHNGHPRSASGATSPTVSEGGESYIGWSSPRQRTSALGSPVSSQYDRPERGRRGSGSYYNAALSGTLNLPMRYDDLAALSPVVRKEVLTGELSRRVKSMGTVAPNDVDHVVEALVSLSLGEVVQGIQDASRLAQQVDTVARSLYPPAPPVLSPAPVPAPIPAPALAHTPASLPEKSPSPSVSASASVSVSASQDSRLLDPSGLSATASAPEHPSTPISMSASLLSTPPRTSSPSGSVCPASAGAVGAGTGAGSRPGSGTASAGAATERERMHTAVARLETHRQAELTALLMSLPKRERALCLFNVEVLRAKLADAKMVLDSEAEGGEDEGGDKGSGYGGATPADAPPHVPATSNGNDHDPITAATVTTQTDLTESRSSPSQPLTLASLAKLPAAEIIRLANSTPGTGLLPKPDPLVVKATDEFIDSLLDKPITAQKQALGDKLHKVVKTFGIRGTPKLTIMLLDSDDLRALAHLMNSYPSVLKEKAMLVGAAYIKKK